MTLELLLAEFDGLIQTPADVEKLNATILQWAVQGRLVPQCADDESASALIERITAKKASLMKEGKLRKTKRIPNVEKSEIPYFLPKGWEWSRWDHVSLLIGDVDHKMPKEIAEGIPYISPRDFANENEIDFENAKKISLDDFERLSQKIKPEYGDIIFPRYGTIGVNRFVKTHINFLASYSCAIVKTMHGYIEPKYAFFYSLSPLVLGEIEKYTNKTTQPNVGIGSIKNFLFPLPPLAEQKRIVARVDELLGQTAVLTQQLATVNEQRRGVHTAVLHQLTTKTSEVSSERSSPTSEVYTLATHFDRFYVDADTVAELKQAILQLAVQGRLVPQDERDEDAAVLLARIQEEKKRLGIKTTKLSEIKDEEISFTLPSNWKWTRLGELTLLVKDGPHYSPKYVEEGIPFISTRNISPVGIDFSNTKYISRELHQELSKRIKPELGDILYTKGGTTGIARVNTYDREFNVWVHVAVLRLGPSLYPFYIQNALNSPHCYRQSQELTHGLGNQDLGLTRMIMITVPLPPLNEQKRIVAKVDELFALCDQLAGQLTTTAASRTQLLEAVLAQA